MARPLRIEYPGAVFHVTSRGNERRDIYCDDNDRTLFLELLAEVVERFGWILPAYVLMSNHFHLAVELTRETLSTGMQWLNSKYSQAFNRRHERVGHLLQGRFHAPLVEKETYMLEVLRYIVLNPVRAGLVDRPEDHVWSSYGATAGMVSPPDWLATDKVLAYFGEDRGVAQSRYRAFVSDGISLQTNIWANLIGQIYVGQPVWVESMKDRVQSRPRDNEHPRAQRLMNTSMAGVIAAVAAVLAIHEDTIRHGRGGWPRMLAAWIASRENVAVNAIASALRLRSAGRVSQLIRQCDEDLRTDHSLRKAAEHCLDALRGVGKSVELKI